MTNLHKCILIALTLFIFNIGGSAFQIENNSAQEKSQTGQIIITATEARIRSEPNLTAEIVKKLKLGAILPIADENDKWYQVKLSESEVDEEPQKGWISKTISAEFTKTDNAEIYKIIADKYARREKLDVDTAGQLIEFLGKAADDVRTYEDGGNFRLRRLQTLASALKNIPFDKFENEPYKTFLGEYKDEIVYSEPAGEWYVRSDEFWRLHSKYKEQKVGEEIAWQAAKNPLPGECEGYVNCHLYILRATSGEYLNFYPNGRYAAESLQNIIYFLTPITADAKNPTSYYAANDISDRAEFNNILTELRAIISKLPQLEKAKALQQIKQIGEGFR